MSLTKWDDLARRSRKRRLSQRRKKEWLKLTAVLGVIFLNGCLMETSSILGAGASITGAYFDYLTSTENSEPILVTPPIAKYSDDIQALAASELKNMKLPCPRTIIVDECSASARLIIDYGDLRRKIRAAENN